MDKKRPGLHVLILAAGSGSRLGGDLPKAYQKISGIPILLRTIKVFQDLEDADPSGSHIHVVIGSDHHALYRETVADLPLAPAITGGKERNESVYNGIKHLSGLKDDDILLIHDAARPFIRQKDILKLIGALEGACVAATLATPVTSTLRGKNGTPLDRDGLWEIQTPQAFRFKVIRDAHEHATGIFTDDAGRVAAQGIDVKLVEGSRDNLKITTPGDLVIAEDMVRGRESVETRTGFGFDVHPFDLSKKTMILCGVSIATGVGLAGHSDADAGLHALTDALLGVIGEGDIGTFFPPEDPKWKGQSSLIFLNKATTLLHEKGGRIVNADLTFLAEIPKIAPYRAAMKEVLATALGLTPDRIGIKATTTEGLGFIGRKEGLAAQAVVSVEFRR